MKKIKDLLACLFVGSMILLAGAVPTTAQIGVGVEFGNQPRTEVVVNGPPVCDYGYYDYAPYACAPWGFYGDGYFYNGVFIGVGPWGGYGYSHGWGEHRFRNNGRGGSYRGNAGRDAHRNASRGNTRGNNGRRNR